MTDTARVLVVEDEWFLAEDHALLLREAGFEVVGPVPTVSAALNLIAGEKIDIALLDIGLSGEYSYPVAERLDSLGIPFLFLSGYVSRDLPQHLSHRRVLSKPALPTEMLSAVRALIGGPKQ